MDRTEPIAFQQAHVQAYENELSQQAFFANLKTLLIGRFAENNVNVIVTRLVFAGDLTANPFVAKEKKEYMKTNRVALHRFIEWYCHYFPNTLYLNKASFYYLNRLLKIIRREMKDGTSKTYDILKNALENYNRVIVDALDMSNVTSMYRNLICSDEFTELGAYLKEKPTVLFSRQKITFPTVKIDQHLRIIMRDDRVVLKTTRALAFLRYKISKVKTPNKAPRRQWRRKQQRQITDTEDDD